MRLVFGLKTKKARVTAKQTLRDFREKHADCEQQLKVWYNEAKQATRKSPNEIKENIFRLASWKTTDCPST